MFAAGGVALGLTAKAIKAPALREVARMTYSMVDLSCASHARPSAAVTLDIDDSCDVVHGHQQLALLNAHCDERCFLPVHVYDTATARPVAILLLPGKTPTGAEIRGHLRRLVRRIRTHWPDTRLTIRGDSHYGRHEVMTWREASGLDDIFGLSGNDVLDRPVDPIADDGRCDAPRRRHKWFAGTPRPATAPNPGDLSVVFARIEATPKGLDIRYVVTNRTDGSAEWLRDTMYCARGQAENLIKLPRQIGGMSRYRKFGATSIVEKSRIFLSVTADMRPLRCR